ncbi:deoxynucleoside kinase [Balneolaceae bacterium ANBcel3]|nr:deoxynucleoside kinase [Balneolaceae bacterium ANBcel3]
MNPYNFIAVEGVIGAGKTSLARLLAERHNARLVLEQFEENPFLPKFYEDRERYAFQTQLAFLASRFKQQDVLRSRDLFQELVISDYLFDKDRIFARLNLSGDEMALYDSIYSIMNTIAAKADLVVYIQANVDRLMQNIRQRGRPYEKEISRTYIEELNDAYNHFFHHYTRSPLIIVNASEIDFVQNEGHLKYIEDHIFLQPIRSHTTHITPR